MEYQYDAFFSYKRDPQSDSWHQTVKDKLAFWLRQELGQPVVRLFFDTEEIRTGSRWRQKLSDGLKHSKCLVCIWSPLYFRSKWCVSEWWTFLERERTWQRDLVLPASYHDGHRFPLEAQLKQIADFSDYTSIMSSFWNTELAVEFENRCLKAFAKDLAAIISNAPPYQESFPVVEAPDDKVKDEEVIERIADN